MEDTWTRLKHSGLPVILMLPVFIWFSVSCAGLQVLATILLPLGRKQEYAQVTRWIFTLMHRPLLYLWEYSGSRIYLYNDSNVKTEILSTIGFNQSMVACNHRGDLDWLVGLLVQDNGGGLGCCKAIIKSSLLMVPFFGLSWWSSDFISISRNWKNDSRTLDAGYRQQHQYRKWALPYCLTIFPEGTRLTPEKLADSQEFCKSRSLPVLQTVLCPRVKGFWSAVNGLQLDAVYDTTVVASPSFSEANILTLAKGKPAEFHIHMERVDPKHIPRDEEKLNTWLLQRWQQKDERLQRFFKEGHLGGDQGTARRHLLTTRSDAFRILMGSIAWYFLSVACFLRWCVQNGYYRFLFGTGLGTVLCIALLFAVIQQVHFKKSELKKAPKANGSANKSKDS
jgi:1-acyl-sn-glycerol-3-phosphate acyltransferase